MRSYRVNEIFFSPQGEGARQGDASVFVRFAGCNLRCDIEPGRRSPGGFACDTEFMSGIRMSADQIIKRADHIWKDDAPRWVVFTGGEPMLQLDSALVQRFHKAGWRVQIETNGTRAVPEEWSIDWLTVSPKVAEHALKQLTAHEVKYVRGYGQDVPKTRITAQRKFISPAFDGLQVEQETVEWCKQLVARNPDWHLSIQMHKILGNR